MRNITGPRTNEVTYWRKLQNQGESWFFTHTKYCTVDQVKKDMISRAYGLNDREEGFVSCFKRKSGGRPPGK